MRMLISCCVVAASVSFASAKAQSLEPSLDEEGKYAVRGDFNASGTADALFDRALDWAERTYARYGDRIGTSRHRIVAHGSFQNPASDLTDFIYHTIRIDTRDDHYTVRFDEFVYQVGVTYPGIAFELSLPRREEIHRTTAEYIRGALAGLRTAVNASWKVDSVRFRLSLSESGYVLYHTIKGQLAVPAAWLAPPDNPETGPEPSPSGFAERVTAFAIDDGLTGLHLSSHEVQEEEASGRDVFLIFDEQDGTLRDGQMLLGASKGRGIDEGCRWALYHRFVIGDVDEDGRADVGVLREEINCVGLPAGLETQYPLKWHVFTEYGWEYRPEFDGDGLPHTFELPLVGLDESPTEVVRRMDSRR